MSVTLAKLLQDYLVANPVHGEVLVPVPLHPKRIRERGYNQSGLLAKELGKLTGLPLAEDCLIRQQHTHPQSKTTTINQRRTNVASAFTCHDSRLQSRQILLINNVSTSGVTLDTYASALKATGAASVWGLVLAREI